jgi:hypothetical protein
MDKEWTGYQSANNDHVLPKSTSAIYPTSSSEAGIVGFQDLTPYTPNVLARYDAMSGSWEGVKASNAYAKNIASAQAGPAPANTK